METADGIATVLVATVHIYEEARLRAEAELEHMNIKSRWLGIFMIHTLLMKPLLEDPKDQLRRHAEKVFRIADMVLPASKTEMYDILTFIETRWWRPSACASVRFTG